MNDDDIIKTLECCSSNRVGCSECPGCKHGDGKCVDKILLNALDLIKRQKAEIERLKAGEYRYIGGIVHNTRIEAIEELAGRLEARLANNSSIRMAEYQFVIADINDVAKEMTEVQHDGTRTTV